METVMETERLADIIAQADERPQKGAWAPGNYLNECDQCGFTFVGDKRSYTCADCAYKSE